ncbi:HEPN domain-containing protein [Niameybacter massiliensis]|uniref:HEPN domain-containing protein n=1 Tax=Holtiella tumoricola TaxID=3018743 RepID=A0AA42DLW0_9FIRM|nr:HEPN domain-containing protein [Holtiella tumoricola]MDA3731459.1 HEPN domain-containing protein [Holtiella tumoricola]
MVDVLSLNNNIPLILVSHDDGVFTGGKINTRRRLEKSDFIEAFNMARKFEIEEPILLKAIGWYSKGKYTPNMLDKFVAYWNAIEIIGKAYHHENERTRQGVKNKIYQCFIECYGEVENWNLPDNWIDDMHDMRSCIVHGGKDTTAEAINEVAQLIPKMESITYELINKIIDAKYDRKNFEYIPWGELF